MDVGVTHEQVHVGDPVHVLEQAVELIETSRLGPVQRESSEFCSKLEQTSIHNTARHIQVNESNLLRKDCYCVTTEDLFINSESYATNACVVRNV